jgi:hypothetical protein
MSVAVAVLGVLLAVVCVASALADFRGVPQVLETLARLGVPSDKARTLGAIKLLAAVGLAAGFAVRGLHVATGFALFLYFAIATVAHVRVRDGARNSAPAFVLCALSVTFTLAALAA